MKTILTQRLKYNSDVEKTLILYRLNKLTKMKKIILINLISLFILSFANANDPKSIGKFKNWETFTYNDGKGNVTRSGNTDNEALAYGMVFQVFKSGATRHWR